VAQRGFLHSPQAPCAQQSIASLAEGQMQNAPHSHVVITIGRPGDIKIAITCTDGLSSIFDDNFRVSFMNVYNATSLAGIPWYAVRCRASADGACSQFGEVHEWRDFVP